MCGFKTNKKDVTVEIFAVCRTSASFLLEAHLGWGWSQLPPQGSNRYRPLQWLRKFIPTRVDV